MFNSSKYYKQLVFEKYIEILEIQPKFQNDNETNLPMNFFVSQKIT